MLIAVKTSHISSSVYGSNLFRYTHTAEYPSLPNREFCLLFKNMYYYSFVLLFSFTSFGEDPCFRIPALEAEFLDVIGTKFAIHSHLYYGFYSPLPLIKSSLKLVCSVSFVYGNLKSEKSQDYAYKSQRNCMFMNSASDSFSLL